ERVGWALFLAACLDIARFESQRLGQKVVPFSLAAQAPKILDVFVLEVWLSEILDFLEFGDSQDMSNKDRASARDRLLRWVSCDTYLDPRVHEIEAKPHSKPYGMGIIDLLGGEQRWQHFEKFAAEAQAGQRRPPLRQL